MPGAADQVVALLSETHQVVSDRQVAQPQKVGNRYLLGARQAGTALMTLINTEPFMALVFEVMDHVCLVIAQGTIGPLQCPSQVQIRRCSSAEGQGWLGTRCCTYTHIILNSY